MAERPRKISIAVSIDGNDPEAVIKAVKTLPAQMRVIVFHALLREVRHCCRNLIEVFGEEEEDAITALILQNPERYTKSKVKSRRKLLGERKRRWRSYRYSGNTPVIRDSGMGSRWGGRR